MPLPLTRYPHPCRAPFWARGGHGQTLIGHFLPSPGARFEREREHVIELPDGDRLVAFERPGATGVRVHLFHGLSGDVNSEYLRRTAAVLGAQGHGVWAVNHRGCGAGAGLARGAYHSGKTGDMQAALARSRELNPELIHVVLGFSLSANMALLLAAQQLGPLPDAILAVNPPVDLLRTSVDIGTGFNRIYERRFIYRLRRAVREREEAGLTARHYEIPLSLSLCEFDDLFTAPENGFADGADYYRQCSSLPHLDKIGTPAVIVTAGDDPFVDPSVLPAEAPDSLFFHVEPTGGHVGYVARRGLGYERWLDGALVHYLEELLGPLHAVPGTSAEISPPI